MGLLNDLACRRAKPGADGTPPGLGIAVPETIMRFQPEKID
jgi:hypothetical protein